VPSHQSAISASCSEPARCLGLGKAVDLGQGQRLALLVGQPVDQGTQARGDLVSKRLSDDGSETRFVLGQLEIGGGAGGQLRPRRPPPVVIDDRVAGDLMHPRDDAVGVLELIAVAVDGLDGTVRRSRRSAGSDVGAGVA
jgi:hypothetical protein